ncbi:MAG: hypothetical protein KIT11_07645 [Fimbriimonadaceae bacterium]|nr:hypothetical protein [Fimbriimonadaceae bacterium]QYK56226.1 MAG: hypothetical protein KF733_01835 [Fimbriimonadaceae bacterium]
MPNRLATPDIVHVARTIHEQALLIILDALHDAKPEELACRLNFTMSQTLAALSQLGDEREGFPSRDHQETLLQIHEACTKCPISRHALNSIKKEA